MAFFKIDKPVLEHTVDTQYTLSSYVNKDKLKPNLIKLF